MGERYLRTIFGFFGITDMETIALENLDGMPEKAGEVVEEGKKQAKELASTF